jgi:hypothetical protein
VSRLVLHESADGVASVTLLVNQASHQTGLPLTQLIGTARHPPEGAAFTRAATDDVRGAVLARDGIFGDFGAETVR